MARLTLFFRVVPDNAKSALFAILSAKTPEAAKRLTANSRLLSRGLSYTR